MKRLILCGVALILASGALTPRTVEASTCTLANRCYERECARFCAVNAGADTGTCVDICTCRCIY
jgi:hypothetical protein